MTVGFLCSYLDECSSIGLNEFVNCRIDYWSQCLCLTDPGMVGLAQVLCWFLVLSSIGGQNYFCFRFPPKLVPFHTWASILVIIHGYQTRGPFENCQLQSGSRDANR